MMIVEMGKVDMSFATFAIVHNSIGQAVIDQLGSEAQRQFFLPGTMSLDKICSFGLTEPKYGSDASGL